MKEIILENILAESIKNSNSYKKDEFIINAMREVANQCFDLAAEEAKLESHISQYNEINTDKLMVTYWTDKESILKLKDQVK